MFTLMEIELCSSYYCMIFHFYKLLKEGFSCGPEICEKSIASVSHGCYSKWLQTWWLKTPEMYFLTVLQAGSPKWVALNQNHGVGRIIFPLKLQEQGTPCLFQLLVAAGALAISSLLFLPLWSRSLLICHCQISFSASFLRERTLWCHLGPTQIILINLPIKILNLKKNP